MNTSTIDFWEGKLVYLSFTQFVSPPLKCWFLTGQIAEWYLASVNYWLVMQYYVLFFVQQIKIQNQNSHVVETANSFPLHKLLGTEDFFLPAHLTLQEFFSLGRKGILWFHLQMSRRIIVPIGIIDQAFGLFGNTVLGDWCQFWLVYFFHIHSTVLGVLLIYLWNKWRVSCLRKEICW